VQLQGYVNRFGSGLVIYWFGFVEEIRQWTPPDIAIASRLPEEWVLPGDTAVRRAAPPLAHSLGHPLGYPLGHASGAAAAPGADSGARVPGEAVCAEAPAGVEGTVSRLGGLEPHEVVALYRSEGLLDRLPGCAAVAEAESSGDNGPAAGAVAGAAISGAVEAASAKPGTP